MRWIVVWAWVWLRPAESFVVDMPSFRLGGRGVSRRIGIDASSKPEDWKREVEILQLQAEKLRLEARKEELDLLRERRASGLLVPEKKKKPLATTTTTKEIDRDVIQELLQQQQEEDDDEVMELDWLFPNGWLPSGIMNKSLANTIKAAIPSKAFYIEKVESSSTCLVFRGRIRSENMTDCYAACSQVIAEKFPELSLLLIEDPAAFVDMVEEDEVGGEAFRPPLSLVVIAKNAGPGLGYQNDKDSSFLLPVLRLDPTENRICSTVLWLSSLMTLILYSASSFTAEDLNQIISNESLFFNIFPVMLLIVLNALVHETAHLLTAQKLKYKGWSRPTPTPSISTGLLGTINSLQDFPENRSQIMAVSLAGPIAGLLFSLVFLLLGTFLFEPPHLTNPNDLVFSPQIPAYAIRSSTIASAIFAFAQPSLATSVITESSNIQLSVSPFFLAGLASSISNSLQLIPIGRSDGARALTALIGRNAAVFVTAVLTTIVFFNALFNNNDLLLAHLLIALTFYARTDPPCRDEASEPNAQLANLYAVAVSFAVFFLLPCPLAGLSSPTNMNLPPDFPVIL